jgi:hypothetical protein
MMRAPAEFTITPDGVQRPLGLVPSVIDTELLYSAPAPLAGAIVPVSELRPFNDWPSFLKVLNQGAWNACTYFASAQALMFVRHMSGLPYVPLDPFYPYFAVTGGSNVGTNIIEASFNLAEIGMPPEGTPKAEAAIEAKRFRSELSETLVSWPQLLSEAARRRPIVTSVCVGNRYHHLDDEGVMGIETGQANHAIFLGGGLRYSPRHGWMIRHVGSWGEAWGNAGFGWYTEAHFNAARYVESYTMRAASEDLTDASAPPPVPVA